MYYCSRVRRQWLKSPLGVLQRDLYTTRRQSHGISHSPCCFFKMPYLLAPLASRSPTITSTFILHGHEKPMVRPLATRSMDPSLGHIRPNMMLHPSMATDCFVACTNYTRVPSGVSAITIKADLRVLPSLWLVLCTAAGGCGRLRWALAAWRALAGSKTWTEAPPHEPITIVKTRDKREAMTSWGFRASRSKRSKNNKGGGTAVVMRWRRNLVVDCRIIRRAWQADWQAGLDDLLDMMSR
ncbi:hypothetical protein F5Y19DRAFT_433985 [Xylariaceae sp. FL1651]|nr:hypothetical protein F5Y19DRAFT_433985 [Xylariaceae sp. FL1651]